MKLFKRIRWWKSGSDKRMNGERAKGRKDERTKGGKDEKIK